jgi:hypothetical protein
MSLANENDMLCNMLAKAEWHDGEYKVRLEVSHSQLAMLGMYAETLQKQAVAASGKKKGGQGFLMILQLLPICTEII